MCLKEKDCVVSYKHGHEWGNLLTGWLTVTFTWHLFEGDGILFMYGFIYLFFLKKWSNLESQILLSL
jgi:hypothetical protein